MGKDNPDLPIDAVGADSASDPGNDEGAALSVDASRAVCDQHNEPTTRLNYVIPEELERLLTQYCVQTEMKPGPLVRRLITDFLKHELTIDPACVSEHPKGRRTSVDLPARMLESLEERCNQLKAPSKAAVIARLLADFLPARVLEDGGERIAVNVPSAIFNQIYAIYGPGAADEVLAEALCDLIQRTHSRAIAAPQEA